MVVICTTELNIKKILQIKLNCNHNTSPPPGRLQFYASGQTVLRWATKPFSSRLTLLTFSLLPIANIFSYTEMFIQHTLKIPTPKDSLYLC